MGCTESTYDSQENSNMKWKNTIGMRKWGERVTDDGQMFYYCCKEDKHEHGVRFLVHKHTCYTTSVMGHRPVLSRICDYSIESITVQYCHWTSLSQAFEILSTFKQPEIPQSPIKPLCIYPDYEVIKAVLRDFLAFLIVKMRSECQMPVSLCFNFRL